MDRQCNNPIINILLTRFPFHFPENKYNFVTGTGNLIRFLFTESMVAIVAKSFEI
jgi:hypothetical protein